MKTLKTGMLLPAAAMALVLAPGAVAQEAEVVPPENSAVNQYTEAFPTGGGEKDVYDHRGGRLAAGGALGARNTQRLVQHGPEGRAVAELTAETAPVAAVPPETDSEGGVEGATAAGGGGGGDRDDQSAPPKGDPDSAQRAAAAFDPDEVDGSSGPWAVIGGALGSSSGGMGILLPLLLLVTIAWAIAYAMRQRRAVG